MKHPYLYLMCKCPLCPKLSWKCLDNSTGRVMVGDAVGYTRCWGVWIVTSHGSFTLLWQKILRSSLWITGTKEQRILWIAMLAMKDAEGRVLSSLVGLADAAKLSQDECRAALATLQSPDPNDTSGVENGIRVKQIAGGWEIVNHDLYRFSTEARREFWRQQKAEQRATKGTPKPKIKPLDEKTFTQLNGEVGVFVQSKPDPDTQKMLRKDIEEYQIDGEIK